MDYCGFPNNPWLGNLQEATNQSLSQVDVALSLSLKTMKKKSPQAGIKKKVKGHDAINSGGCGREGCCLGPLFKLAKRSTCRNKCMEEGQYFFLWYKLVYN